MSKIGGSEGARERARRDVTASDNDNDSKCVGGQ